MNAASICIVGLDDYPLLAGADTAAYVGGESVQHVLLARAWRDLGLEVSMIVMDHGQGALRNCGGIRAIAAYAPHAGVPGLLGDELRRHAIGERAREFVATDFSPVRAAQKYLELLQAAPVPHRRDGTAG